MTRKTVYKVLWNIKARTSLRRLDKGVKRTIVDKVESYLARDPEHLGIRLSGKLAGLMRFRVGDYRVIYTVRKAEITIVVVKIGHRSEVYDDI